MSNTSPYNIPCPVCGAKVGEACRRSDPRPHHARFRLAKRRKRHTKEQR